MSKAAKLAADKAATNPCAFLVQPASNQTNVAINSDVTVVLGTEVFDIGSDFASNTFTAPVTGKYQLNATFYMLALDTGASFYEFAINTSNRKYSIDFDPNFSGDLTYYAINFNVLADMDASDTSTLTIYQSGGTQQTDVSANTTFSGYLVC